MGIWIDAGANKFDAYSGFSTRGQEKARLPLDGVFSANPAKYF